jgi:ketosteroid isomerase-like protein
MESWELVARETIRELVVRYAHGVDRGRFDEVAALFADDGVLDLPEGRRLTGPDAIREFLGGTRDTMRAGATSPSIRHHVTSHRIDVEGPDGAVGFAYFLVVTERGPDHWGRYADRYVRAGDRWRFAARRVRLDGRASDPRAAGPRQS